MSLATRIGLFPAPRQAALPTDRSDLSDPLDSEIARLEARTKKLERLIEMQDRLAELEFRARGHGGIHFRAIGEIQRALCEYYWVDRAHLLSKCREARIAWVRMTGYWLSAELTQAASLEIARAWRVKDHGTVLYGIKRVAERMSVEPRYQAEVECLRERLNSSLVTHHSSLPQ